MQAIRISDFPTLRGQDAVKALNEIIDEIERERGKELTEKQAQTLMKVANELIYSIKEEMLTRTSDKYKPWGSATSFTKFEDSEKANQETCKEHRKSHHLSPPTFDENCSREDCSVDCPFR